MLGLSNPAIGLETRRFLRGLIRDDGLDEPCVGLMERVLERIRPRCSSGWVFMLADALGAERERALRAASFVELYYAMVYFTDDVQDGDVPAWMPDLSPPMYVNVMMQLACVTVVRGRDLGMDGLVDAFLTGAVMLRGQRYEILREDWSVDRYRQVAVLSAGRQFETYIRVAAGAADADPAPLVRLAGPLGILVQLRHDVASRDPRLAVLDEVEVERMRSAAADDLAEAVAGVPERARHVVERMAGFALGRGDLESGKEQGR